MKTIKILFSMVFAIALASTALFYSCGEEEYDFNAIEPVIMEVTGADMPMQGRHYLYAATIRGGSSYEWSSALNAEQVAIEGFDGTWKTYFYFPDVVAADAETPEQIIVVETTMGGKSSDPYIDTLAAVTPFTALPITGSTLVNASFNSKYTVSPSTADKVYCSYTWETTAGTITPDTDKPWEMSILFGNEDVGTVTISLIEENTHGLKDTSYLAVEVNEYCALDNWIEDLEGSWSGIDAATAYTTGESQVVTVVVDEKLMMTGLGYDWMINFWGEEVIDGGTIELEVFEDGTVNIPNQYYMTTLYDGAEQDPYTIEGSGRWNNCGDYPTLSIVYEMNNYDTDWGAWCYENGYASTPHFEAELTLDPAKFNFLPKKSIDIDRSFKKR